MISAPVDGVRMRVTFLPDDVTVDVERGVSLMQAAELAEVQLHAPCGGKGTCGRCKVIISGSVDAERDSHISDAEWAAGYRLACRSGVAGDVTVMVPDPPELSRPRVLVRTPGEVSNMTPIVQRSSIEVPVASMDDPTALLERVLGSAGEGIGASVPLDLIRSLPEVVSQCNGSVDVLLGAKGLVTVLPRGSVYGMAVDLGTTTVVVNLIDLDTGGTVAGAAGYNDQILMGEDVLSRIERAEEGDLERLRQLALGSINRLTVEAIAAIDGSTDQVTTAVVAGNTAMAHMMLGVDPSSIRYHPYSPAFNASPMLSAGEIGLKILPAAPVMLVPGTAAWVGGDITAGVVSSGMHRRSELSLLIDVGTNGEVVLGNRDWLMCCSSSAGPAFDGGEVACGMRAMDGAIDRVGSDLGFHVLGDAPPRGICGSGLIDLIAAMLEQGIVDRKGRLQDHISVTERDGIKEMTLCPGIAVNEDDIANLIRSKAAVFAAIRCLLRAAGLTIGAVERLHLAGGFGHYVDPDNAVAIGLLPDIPRDRFSYLGNSSLAGARDVLLSTPRRLEAREVAASMTYVDLSTSPEFFDEFTSALFLPHTDLSLFPRPQ